MNKEHWLLLALWIIFCVFHSVMANEKIKIYISRKTGNRYKYYRPLYSLFAAVSLACILYFQYSVKSVLLFHTNVFTFSLGVLLVIPGLIIMILCINKYFYELSGLQALQHSDAANTLQQSGLHKYVRHPLYLGTLLFIWGLVNLFPYLNNIIASLVITIYTFLGIYLEEKKLLIEFGDSYLNYSKTVPMIIPGLRLNKKSY